MQSLNDVLSQLKALESTAPETLVDVLCRVDQHRAANDDAVGSLLRLGSELSKLQAPTNGASHLVDPFPDYDLPAPLAPPGIAPATRAALQVAGAQHDDITRAMLGTLNAYQGLLERHQRDFDEVFQRRNAGEPEPADETIRRLKDAQTALLKYPIAAQAAFAAMVREGRRYAATPDGDQWKRRLAGSALLAKARTLFEGLSAGLLSEDGAPLPSTYVDGFLKALDRDLEQVLDEVGGLGTAR